MGMLVFTWTHLDSHSSDFTESYHFSLILGITPQVAGGTLIGEVGLIVMAGTKWMEWPTTSNPWKPYVWYHSIHFITTIIMSHPPLTSLLWITLSVCETYPLKAAGSITEHGVIPIPTPMHWLTERAHTSQTGKRPWLELSQSVSIWYIHIDKRCPCH